MLSGIRIVDLTSVVFGPYATQILADLGADVVKVEAPDGDPFRVSAKPAKSRGMSPGYLALNRGKRSIVLDLKQPEDLAVMQALLADADVFIHNVRDEAIRKLRLDYAEVQSIKPDIVYVHCVGFGSGGAYAGLQAYDDVIQAATGAATLSSRVDGGSAPRYIPSLIADKVAGLHAAYGVLAAIIHRLRTGEGQRVEVPMFEAFADFILKEHLAGLTFDPPNAPVCYPRQIDRDRQPFPTADSYISIVPYTDHSWSKVFEVLGDPGFLDDPQFATPMLRFRNIGLLYQGVAARTPARTTEAWARAFHAASIPAMAVRDIGEIRDDPHLRGVNFFEHVLHPTEGQMVQMKQPVSFSAASPEPCAPAPITGQHTAEIKGELVGKTGPST
jgi:crotonobetainyl-CoA:carnitine CoA-transferase CaiB-like acyl-CoA transferase